MRDLIVDVRHAARALLARPSFLATAVLTLAVGIGSTTAIFGVVNGIVLAPLDFPSAERLVTICEHYPGSTPDWCSVSPPNIEDVAARSRTLEAIGIARSWGYHLQTPSGGVSIPSGIASPGMFAALGARAKLGRLIEKSDLVGHESLVAVITDEMWHSRFADAPDIVGRVIVLDKQPVTIVGVLMPGFRIPQFEAVELWRPLHILPTDEQNRDWRGFVAYGRLRRSATLATARTELAGLTTELRAAHFATTTGWDLTMHPLQDLLVGGVRTTLYVLLGAVALVLVIGCANVANLLLARSTERAREIAVRAALGASRGRVVRALLTESLLVALAGTVLGLLLAYGSVDAFRVLAPPGIPRVEHVSVDGRVLSFALALAIGTTLLFGLAPALRATRGDLAQRLREGGRSSSRRGGWLGASLVVAELAMAVVLVSGAAVLGRSFAARLAWQPGFEQDHLLTFTLFASSGTYKHESQVASLWDRVTTELQAMPGVVAVGSASGGPLFGGRETDAVRLAAGSGAASPEEISLRWFDVSPAYFRALGIPLVQGRDLEAADRAGTPFVGLVNETLARRFWPHGAAVGQRLQLARMDTAFRIVGVVRDVPSLDPGVPVEPELYWSNRQLPRPFSYFIVRTAVPPATVVATIRARLAAIDGDLQPGGVATLAERRDRELLRPRFTVVLVTSFGLAALVLAAIGTYGLLAYLVSQRTRELGIRLALGAQRAQIVGMVLRLGGVLAVVGLSLGLAATLVLGTAMRDLVSGVSTRDPLMLGASGVVLLLVSLVACAVPAWRASRVDPLATLGAE